MRVSGARAVHPDRRRQRPSDLHLRAGDTFRGRWQEAIRRAVPWTTLDADVGRQMPRPSRPRASSLLHDPRLLEHIGTTKSCALGYAGDLTTPTLIYLALTSRELERPQNLAVIAPSAAGKNRAVDAALALVPEEAIYMVTAVSARALVLHGGIVRTPHGDLWRSGLDPGRGAGGVSRAQYRGRWRDDLRGRREERQNRALGNTADPQAWSDRIDHNEHALTRCADEHARAGYFRP